MSEKDAQYRAKLLKNRLNKYAVMIGFIYNVLVKASPRHYRYARNSQPPALQKQQLKQPPPKMPATAAGETSEIRNLRPRPTSPEDTIYTFHI